MKHIIILFLFAGTITRLRQLIKIYIISIFSRVKEGPKFMPWCKYDYTHIPLYWGSELSFRKCIKYSVNKIFVKERVRLNVCLHNSIFFCPFLQTEICIMIPSRIRLSSKDSREFLCRHGVMFGIQKSISSVISQIGM